MGTLGDNLLKLTEFPFSYSLIGLLALISGQGINLGEAALDALGPLLIIMGFVATTLSITDPVGRLQKLYLLWRNLVKEYGFKLGVALLYIISREFRKEYQEWEKDTPLRDYWIRLSLSLGSESAYGSLTSMPTFGKKFGSIIPYSVVLTLNPPHLKALESRRHTDKASTKLPRLENLPNDDLVTLIIKVRSLQDTTVRTKWIAREIDKITAMGYFVIIISVFIFAEFYFIGFLDKFLVNFQGIEQARIILIIFSFTVLVAVLIMLIMRLGELKQRSMTTFKFLIERDISKIEEERFAKNRNEIELYLDNGDWTLAQLSVDYTMKACEEYIEPRLKKILEPREERKIDGKGE